MDKHVWKDFVRKSNEAAREAKRAGMSSEEMAKAYIQMASREFDNAPELQEDYDTFAHFAQDVRFETVEGMEFVRDELRKLD